jgi:hypothetical protein
MLFSVWILSPGLLLLWYAFADNLEFRLGAIAIRSMHVFWAAIGLVTGMVVVLGVGVLRFVHTGRDVGRLAG